MYRNFYPFQLSLVENPSLRQVYTLSSLFFLLDCHSQDRRSITMFIIIRALYKSVPLLELVLQVMFFLISAV